MNNMTINELLIYEQKIWKKSQYDDFLKGKEGFVSVPFSMGVTEEYLNSIDKRIMIVGEEANDFGIEYDQWDITKLQDWAIKYLERQLYEKHKDSTEFKNNRSPFWRFFRSFVNKGYSPCWNNIDKAHRYSGTMDTIPLTLDDEKWLSKQYLSGGKYQSLIQREIDISKPSILVFFGPQYGISICTAFGKDKKSLLSKKPTYNNPVQNITNQLGTTVPAFWTFHPAYLQRISKMEEVIETILHEST